MCAQKFIRTELGNSVDLYVETEQTCTPKQGRKRAQIRALTVGAEHMGEEQNRAGVQ